MEISDLATLLALSWKSDHVKVTQFPESSFHERAGSLGMSLAFEIRYSGVVLASMRLHGTLDDLTLY